MKKSIFTVFLFIVFVGLSNSLFIVNQTEQAMVLQFGEPISVIKEPGLKIKMPFIQNVVYYDNRLLDLDPSAEELTLNDQKRLDIDNFTRFRIIDPLLFYQTVLDETSARLRLGDIVNSSVRAVLGKIALPQLLSKERDRIMEDITQRVNFEAKELGVEVLGVRIKRADLPIQISQSVYARMRSEREREAREFRAQGQQVSQEIKSKADREKIIIIAEAQEKAQVIRGEGDNEAINLWATAANKDKEFYAFYRSLEAYKNSMQNKSTMILSPDSEFFRYFGQIPGIKAFK